MTTFYGILIPFLGTTLGAACVFFLRKALGDRLQRALTGFAAGVMVAASVWSLLIPAIEQSAALGRLSFLPAAVGFWIGVAFLLLLDRVIPHLHRNAGQAEGPRTQLQRTTMMLLAVTLHNIPEGMAVGVVYAGYLTGTAQISAAGALALSLGIAIQNFPEGAIISLPLRAEGQSRMRAFAGGVLSGIVEPVGAVLTVLGPVDPQAADSKNNTSLVTRLDFGESSFLFNGDQEEDMEEMLVQSGADLDCDVMTMGHHGSSTSSSQEYLDAVTPEYASISCGRGNQYGHPHDETIEKLEAMGVEYYRTDLDGNITFTSDGETISVRTEKP